MPVRRGVAKRTTKQLDQLTFKWGENLSKWCRSFSFTPLFVEIMVLSSTEVPCNQFLVLPNYKHKHKIRISKCKGVFHHVWHKLHRIFLPKKTSMNHKIISMPTVYCTSYCAAKTTELASYHSSAKAPKMHPVTATPDHPGWTKTLRNGWRQMTWLQYQKLPSEPAQQCTHAIMLYASIRGADVTCISRDPRMTKGSAEQHCCRLGCRDHWEIDARKKHLVPNL